MPERVAELDVVRRLAELGDVTLRVAQEPRRGEQFTRRLAIPLLGPFAGLAPELDVRPKPLIYADDPLAFYSAD